MAKAIMSHKLEFDGYWKIGKAGGVAAYPGVYCLYVWSPDRFFSSRLLYIGESENIEARGEDHVDPSNDMILKLTYHAFMENREREQYLAKDRELYFSAAECRNERVRKRVEAAMINYHRPPANEEYVDDFPFEDTRVFVSGKRHRLDADFTAYQRS